MRLPRPSLRWVLFCSVSACLVAVGVFPEPSTRADVCRNPTSPAPTAPAPTPSSPDPQPPPGGPWTLAFNDEFSDGALDEGKWATNYARSGDMMFSNSGNGEAQWYKRNNVVEVDGQLKLVAKREQTTSPCSGRSFDYSSGMVTSKKSFNFQQGYMEARMWLPKGSGFWPAFWTWPSNEQWPPEIDVMEFYGDNPGLTYHTNHFAGGSSGTTASSPDWTAGWHTFAVDWEAGRLRWFVDGNLVKTDTNSPAMNMYLIANLAICRSDRCPAPNGSTPFPSELKIDYMRVWKR